jgi:ABC-type sugar transport system ATPase subunit
VSYIDLDCVSKSFGTRVAINQLSLHIERSERLVLFGPSGCGKTTVLRLLAGLDVPEKGDIRIDDRVVASSGKISFHPRNAIWEWCFKILRCGLI